MSNTLLTIDMVAKESLRIAHEKAIAINTSYREYDDSYAKKGAKIGDTLRIRNPNQYLRRKGSRVMDVKDQAEASQSITVATQDGVDMKWNSAELALSIDEFSSRYIEPATSALVSGIDGDFIVAMTKATYNTVGTAGTVVGTSADVSAFFNARARLNQMLAPKESGRVAMIDSVTMATMANGLKALFLPADEVSEGFTEGVYKRTAAADLYENERTWTMTNGSDVTGTTDSSATVTDGGTTLAAGIAASVTLTVNQVFTIAGVYACHPETKQSLGYLQQFTNTAGTGAAMTISPATVLTGAKQNVCKSDGTALATTDFNSQTITTIGAASTAYRQNIMYHKEAFAFVTADLELKGDASKCVRVEKDGLSIRLWQGSDIRNDEELLRLDILYGWLAQRPAWACRITN